MGLLDGVNFSKPRSHDLFLAELVLDLYDLLHMQRYGRDPVTVLTFGRIRGIRDEGSIRKVLQRVRETLKPHGVILSAAEITGSARAEIFFDTDEITRLVMPDLERACRLLDKHKRRFTGDAFKRDAGRIRPGALIGAKKIAPIQFSLFGDS